RRLGMVVGIFIQQMLMSSDCYQTAVGGQESQGLCVCWQSVPQTERRSELDGVESTERMASDESSCSIQQRLRIRDQEIFFMRVAGISLQDQSQLFGRQLMHSVPAVKRRGHLQRSEEALIEDAIGGCKQTAYVSGAYFCDVALHQGTRISEIDHTR